MTLALTRLINDLQGNMEVIGSFLETPEAIIEKYGIVGKERNLLLARDVSGLNKIGLDQKSAYVAMSSAHSQLCSCHHIPFCN